MPRVIILQASTCPLKRRPSNGKISILRTGFFFSRAGRGEGKIDKKTKVEQKHTNAQHYLFSLGPLLCFRLRIYVYTQLPPPKKNKHKRPHHFKPRKFDNLRSVPLYSDFVRERFERCLDLYLCPRIRRRRVKAPRVFRKEGGGEMKKTKINRWGKRWGEA